MRVYSTFFHCQGKKTAFSKINFALSISLALLKEIFVSIVYNSVVAVSFQFSLLWFGLKVTSFIYHFFQPRTTLWSINIHLNSYIFCIAPLCNASVESENGMALYIFYVMLCYVHSCIDSYSSSMIVTQQQLWWT